MKIVKRKIKDLIRAEYNPRKINKIQEIDLRESLIRFGLVDPIIINVNKERKNIVIGGHQRIKIWAELGNNDIECNELNLTLDKERELNIRLNKSGGSFDDDLIKEFFEYEELTEWGFTPDELFKPDEKTNGLINDDEIPEVKESKVKRGDIWQLGEHRVMCGDSTSSDDVSKLMNGQKADMVFTDPPYNVDYEGGFGRQTMSNEKKKWTKIANDKKSKIALIDFTRDYLKRMLEFCDGAMYIFMSCKEFPNLQNIFIELGGHWQSTIIWQKERFVFGMKDYKSRYEPILYGWNKNRGWVGVQNEEDIWDLKRDLPSDYVHPTQKPIDLSARAMGNSSKKGNIVLDLFLGSGSTLIAAEKLNRKCYGMELDEKYCDVIIERWEQFTGLKADKING